MVDQVCFFFFLIKFRIQPYRWRVTCRMVDKEASSCVYPFYWSISRRRQNKWQTKVNVRFSTNNHTHTCTMYDVRKLYKFNSMRSNDFREDISDVVVSDMKVKRLSSTRYDYILVFGCIASIFVTERATHSRQSSLTCD